jgi:hypothetical protein
MAYVNEPHSWPFNPGGALQTPQDVVAAVAHVPQGPPRWVGTQNRAFFTPFVVSPTDIREGVGALEVVEDVSDFWSKIKVAAMVAGGLAAGYVGGWMFRELRTATANRSRRRRRGKRSKRW